MELATKDDLNRLKDELITEMKAILSKENPGQKPYLRSGEVMQLLGCSESKLATLRTSGKLPCKKIQGTYYFKVEDIKVLLR